MSDPGAEARRAEAVARPSSRIRARVRRMRERFLFQREMRLRIVSALVLIPMVLVSTWYDELTFALIVTLTGALVLFEWMRMVGAGRLKPLRLVGLVGLSLVAVATLAALPIAGVAVAALVVAIAVGASWGARYEVSQRWVAAGIIYAATAVVALIELRKGADGFGAVIFVFLVAWATDTMAFFVGRRVGGPKLWRAVSPSKTWSGAIGGFVAGIVFGALVALWLNLPVTLGTLFAAALVAVAAQLGDLLESAAKRRFSVKDAGSMIPGHGGVMDRVDGLIAASLVTVILGSAMPGDNAAAGLMALMGAS